jgi:hypothetical protein
VLSNPRFEIFSVLCGYRDKFLLARASVRIHADSLFSAFQIQLGLPFSIPIHSRTDVRHVQT